MITDNYSEYLKAMDERTSLENQFNDEYSPNCIVADSSYLHTIILDKEEIKKSLEKSYNVFTEIITKSELYIIIGEDVYDSKGNKVDKLKKTKN